MLEAIKTLGTTLIYQPLINLLFGFVAVLPGESLGLGIIALTALVRLLLLPSSAQAVRSQREMMALQPKIEEIRAQYKDKPEELNQQLLTVYQRHNVNPFGACLPLLIQLPILYVLYRVFWSGIEAANFGLLYSFVPAPEHLSTVFAGIDLHQPSLWLSLLAGGFQFLQTWQLAAQRQRHTKANGPTKSVKEESPTAVAERLSNRMLYLMPVVTAGVAMTLPSALALYWITTTLFSVGQQWWLLRTQPVLRHEAVTVSVRR